VGKEELNKEQNIILRGQESRIKKACSFCAGTCVVFCCTDSGRGGCGKTEFFQYMLKFQMFSKF